MSNNQNGKGSRYRPKTVSQETWDKNWNLIFKQKKSDSNKTNNSKS